MIRLEGNDTSILAPYSLEDWRSIIVRFNLDNDTPIGGRSGTLNFLKERLVESPLDLASFSSLGVRNFSLDFNHPDLIVTLWQACRMHIDSNAKHAINAKLSYKPSLLAASIRSQDLDDSVFARQHVRNTEALNLDEGFSPIGPSAKIRALARAMPERESLERFLDSGVTINVLRRTQDSLRSVASGISSYIAFCDLTNIDYSPVSSYRSRQFSSLFRPGPTFGNYINRIKKACQILNVPIDGHDALLEGTIKGLKNAQEENHFDNLITLPMLKQNIDFEGIENIYRFFVIFVFISFTSPFGRGVYEAGSFHGRFVIIPSFTLPVCVGGCGGGLLPEISSKVKKTKEREERNDFGPPLSM